MPRALPIELRERIVRAHVERRMTVGEIVEAFDISRSSVRRYIAKYKKGLSLEPGHAPGAAPKLGDDDFEWLRTSLEAAPCTTSHELTAKFNREFRANCVHRSTILRAMHKLGYSYKKNALRASTRTRRRSRSQGTIPAGTGLAPCRRSDLHRRIWLPSRNRPAPGMVTKG